MKTPSSVLPWKSMGREAGGPRSMGPQRGGHGWAAQWQQQRASDLKPHRSEPRRPTYRCTFFQLMLQSVLHGPWLVEPTDVELQIWRPTCQVLCAFPAVQGLACLSPALFRGQQSCLFPLYLLSVVVDKWKLSLRLFCSHYPVEFLLSKFL